MQLSRIENLSRIRQKSSLANFGMAYDGKEFFFFSYGTYEWVCYLDASFEGDVDKFKGTILFDFDSLKKITEIFVSGEVNVVRDGNQLIFRQEECTLYISIKETKAEIMFPMNLTKSKFKEMGEIGTDILELTKMTSMASQILPESMDNFVILTPDSAIKATMHYIAIRRGLEWSNFPKDASVYIDAAVLRLFNTCKLYFNEESYKITDDSVFVVIPKPGIRSSSDLEKPFAAFKSEPFKEHIQFKTSSLIQLINLLNKVYEQSNSTILTFIAKDEGFLIVANDAMTRLEYFIKCEHKLLEGFQFIVNGKIISNLKYLDCETFYARFTFKDNTPLMAVFYSELEKDYQDSDKVFLATLVHKV